MLACERSRRSSRSAGCMTVRRGVVLALELEEGLAVRFGRPVVEDFDAAASLFEGEVAHVADEDDELFLVVGAAEGFGGGLDDDDAGLGGGCSVRGPVRSV